MSAPNLKWGRPQTGNVIHLRVRHWNVNKTRCGVHYTSKIATGDRTRVTCEDCQRLIVNDVEVALTGRTSVGNPAAIVHFYVGERSEAMCRAPVLYQRTTDDPGKVTCPLCRKMLKL